MADDHLRLLASIEDQFTGPLGKLKQGLQSVHDTSKRNVETMRKEWGGARDEVTKFTGALQGMQPVLSAVGVSSFGAVLSFGGIANAVRNFAGSTRDMSRFAREVGLTTDELRTFAAIGERFGLSTDQMKGAIGKFATEMDQLKRRTGSLYRDLQGMGLGDLAEKLIDAPNMKIAFERAIKEIGDIQNPQRRRELAEKLLGSAEFSAVAKEMQGKLPEIFKQYATEMGKISRETEKAAEEFEEHFSKVSRAWEKAKIATFGPILKGTNRVLDEIEQGIKDPRGSEVRDLKARRKEAQDSAAAAPEGSVVRRFREWQVGDLDERIKKLEAEMGPQGPAAPQAGTGAPDRARRVAELEAKRKDAQERYDWNEGNATRSGPQFAGRQRELSDEIKRLTDEIRKLREGGGATAQQSSFGGIGMGGGPLIQRASFGGLGPFGGGYAGGMGGGGGRNGSGSYGGVGSYQGPAGGGTPTGSSAGNLTALIDAEAKRAGVDPGELHGIRAGESLHTNKYDVKSDRLEDSYGPFQLNRRGGLGAEFERDTGLDVRDPRTIPDQVRWVARYIARQRAKDPNWSPGRKWMGYRGPRDANPRWGDSGYKPSGGPLSDTGKGSPLGDTPYRITGRVGDPRGGHRHAGLDMAAPGGTTFYASNAGRVTKVSPSGDVTITNPDGSSQTYRHVMPSVRQGEEVGEGKAMGVLRHHDPRSTGPHLHYERRGADGRLQDPEGYLAAHRKRVQEAAERARDGKLTRGPLWRLADQDDRAAQRAPDQYGEYRAWKEGEARAGRVGEEDEDDAKGFARWKARQGAGPLPPRRPAGQALLERVLPGRRGRDGADGASGGKGSLRVEFVNAPKGTKVSPSMAGLFRDVTISHQRQMGVSEA